MSVYLPFRGAVPRLVRAILRTDGYPPILYRIGDGDDEYRQMMQGLWAAGKTFVIVEHDILPWPGAIAELIACPCEWGTYSYRYHGGIGIAHMLGCAKITDKLIAKLPGLWDEPVHWGFVDQHLFRAAGSAGQEPHLHRPPVLHLNPKELADV